jgi:hypothetical protein
MPINIDITQVYFQNGLHGNTYDNSECHGAKERMWKHCALRYGFLASRRVLRVLRVPTVQERGCLCVFPSGF